MVKGRQKFKGEIIFVDERGRKWDKDSLDDLFKNLYMEADRKKAIDYYIKSKYLF